MSDIELKLTVSPKGEEAAVSVLERLIPGIGNALKVIKIRNLVITGELNAPGGAVAEADIQLSVTESG